MWEARFSARAFLPDEENPHLNCMCKGAFMSRVKTLSKSNLADTEWLTVQTDGNPAFRFFKVVVEMP